MTALTPEEIAEAMAVVAAIDAGEGTTTLRFKIEAVITGRPGDAGAAALAICVLLENEIGLAGNGWFDDDDAVLAAIA